MNAKLPEKVTIIFADELPYLLSVDTNTKLRYYYYYYYCRCYYYHYCDYYYNNYAFHLQLVSS